MEGDMYEAKRVSREQLNQESESEGSSEYGEEGEQELDEESSSDEYETVLNQKLKNKVNEAREDLVGAEISESEDEAREINAALQYVKST